MDGIQIVGLDKPVRIAAEMKGSHSAPGYHQPPDRKSMHSQIVRDLGMRIVSGEYRVGD
ncbi:MAG: hypothetical protein H7340_08380, partial [Variovorax sp.]|nr:hypothetical protein [Variovorax sp.]